MSALRDRRWQVCFVCSGNICRSPMAEVLLVHHLQEAGYGAQVEVISAGTLGIVDHGAAPHAVACAADADLDLGAHRSRGIDESLIESCDLILGMAVEHVTALREAYPDHAGRVYLFGSFPELHLDGPEIDDPVGGELEDFQQTFRELSGAMPAIAAEIPLRADLTKPPADPGGGG